MITKRTIALATVLFLLFSNFAYAQNVNHWASENFEYFKQKNILTEEEPINLNKNISSCEFRALFEQVTNIALSNKKDMDCDDNALTRIDVVNLLADTLEYEEILKVSVRDYRDSQQIDNSLIADVNRFIKLGILRGYDDKTLRIQDKLTFGEAITIVKRINDLKTIQSINSGEVTRSNKDLQMGSVSKATNNTVSLFIKASLLNEKLFTMDIDKVGMDEWIKTRNEASETWDKVYQNSLTMQYAADRFISDVEEKMENSMLASNGNSLEWAEKIQNQFDAIKSAQKLKEFSKQLGVDAKQAFEILKLSSEIVHGDAMADEAFYKNLELIARTTKTASKVGLFIGGTIITAGMSTAAAGTLYLGEAAGVVVSGVDVILDVSSLGSAIIVGENDKVTMTFDKMKDDFAPVSSIFGLSDFGGADLGNQIFYVGEQIADLVNEGKLLGIKISSDAEGGSIAYVEIPLEDGQIPQELLESEMFSSDFMEDYQQLFSDMNFALDYEKNQDYASTFDGISYEDINAMLDQLDMGIEEFDRVYDELIQEIEELEGRPIDEILDEIEKEIEEERLGETEELEDPGDSDESDDSGGSDGSDDSGDSDEDDSEDPDEGDSDDSGDSDEDDSDDDIIYYTLTVQYVIDDGGVAAPATFKKEDYEYRDSYNIPTPTIEGYTPDKATVEGIIARDTTVTVIYTKDFEETYTLFINYVIDDEAVLAPDPYNDDSLKEGEEFSVPSPTIEGYTADTPVVTGIMDETFKYITVIYYNDTLTYQLTINYIYEDETKVAEPIVKRFKVGEDYNIPSPTIDGYYADIDNVTGSMPAFNRVVTVTYREVPVYDEFEIGGYDDPAETVRIPEGTSFAEAVSSYLPKKIKVYLSPGPDTMDLNVDWKEDPVVLYPTVDSVVGIFPYTGLYTFEGEFLPPSNVKNSGGFIPTITVEFYPYVVDDTGVDYSQLTREIEGSSDWYYVWYEDDYGDKQGAWENYVDGLISERYVYKDNTYHGIHEKYEGPEYSKTLEANYNNGVLDGLYKTWYTHNGAKEFIGQYSNDKKTGTWEQYYFNGQLMSEGSYEEGLETGTWEYYYENGQIKARGAYAAGEEIGEWEYWNEDGSPL